MSESGSIRQGLRKISAEEVRHVQQVVKLFPHFSRKVLAQTLCEHLNWYSPSGALKEKHLDAVTDKSETGLWNEYVERYHRDRLVFIFSF